MGITGNLFAATALACAAAAASAPELTASAWDGSPIAWDFDASAGKVRATGVSDMIALRGERCACVSISARLTPEAAGTNGWATMGLALDDGEKDYWHLALVQAPPDGEGRPGRRFFELAEMRDGTWLAQSRDRLPCAVGKRSEGWEYGRTYAATLKADYSGICGEVRDAEGRTLFSVRYSFPAGAKAVTCGRPALHATVGFSGVYGALDVERREPRPKESAEVRFPPYASDSFVPSVKDRATGFFRVVRRPDGRWWTIDPLGRGVVLLGVDHVKYRGHWSARTKRSVHLEVNRRKYPDKADWETNTLARLKAWGFNMLGGGCDPALERRGLIHARALSLSSGMCMGGCPPELYICPNEGRPCTAFPNVFHPKFEAWCDHVARMKCAPNRDDPWLLGYFIDNELAWWGRGARDAGLFDAVAALPETHPARRAQREFLAARGIGGGDVPADVKLDFLRLAAERYFGTAAAAIRRADPNHLVLGARFAGKDGAHAAVWETAGRHCDVVTFNCYPWADIDRNVMYMYRSSKPERTAEAFAQLYETVKRPLMVTEWSFPALDSGLPCMHGAGQRFRTQSLRARASELFAHTMLSMPFMLGYDYFMWVDEPAAGLSDAFPEDSNYGLISEQDVPYRELTEMFAALHRDVGALRFGGLPEERTPQRPPTVLADDVRRAMDFGRGAGCVRDGDAYTVTNCAGLVMQGRVGGKAVFDSVKADGVELGRFTGMFSDIARGGKRWWNMSRVTAAEWRDGRLTVTGEGGGRGCRFSFTFAIVPASSRPWFLCELVRAGNAGAEEIEVSAFLLRQYADYATDKKGNEAFNRAPNLWDAPDADAWFRAADGAFFGGFTCAPNVPTFRYVASADGRSQHPDAIFNPPSRLVLAPGGTYEPKGAVWMIAICGKGGGRKAWDATVDALERQAWK